MINTDKKQIYIDGHQKTALADGFIASVVSKPTIVPQTELIIIYHKRPKLSSNNYKKCLRGPDGIRTRSICLGDSRSAVSLPAQITEAKLVYHNSNNWQAGFIKLTKKTLIMMLMALLTFTSSGIYLLFFMPKSASAAWLDDSWAYRQNSAITNSSGSAQTDWQIQITLNTATLITAGKMQSSCNDIRITDTNGKILPHWVESGTNGCNQTSTYIWAKVPSIPTSGATVYIYYGNPTAVKTADGSKVFLFFDDFENGNLNKWSTTTSFSASTDVANSGSYGAKATGAVTAQLLTNISQSQSVALVFEQRAAQTSSRADPAIKYTGGIAGNRAFLNLDVDGSAYRDYFDNTGSRVSTAAFSYSANTWYRTEYNVDITNNTLTIKANGTTYVNGVSIQDITSVDTVSIGKDSGWGSGTMYYDDFAVRKFVATEPSAATPATEEQAPGPIAYWKFDDGQGSTAQDATSSNNDGTLSGATKPTWQTEDQCISGKCLFFGGSTSYISVNNSAALKPTANMTLGAWFRTPGTGGWQQIVIKDDNDNERDYKLQIAGASGATWSANAVLFCNNIGGTANCASSGTTTVTDNKWHHVVGVNDGTNLLVYLDGVLVSTDGGSKGGTQTHNSYNVLIGTNMDTSGSPITTQIFKGYIDEVKIYNFARSAAQIKTDYASGLANAGFNKGSSAVLGASTEKWLSDGLVGYWKMDESSWTQDCTATSVTDSSGNGNNGKSCPSTTGPAGGSAGKFGTAGSFDGTDDYVSLGTTNLPTGANTRTVTAWFKPSASPDGGFRTLVGYGSANTDQDFSLVYDNTNGYTLATYNDSCASGTIPVNGQWDQVAVTYDGTNTKIYVNSSLVKTCAQTLNTGVVAGARIGDRATATGQFSKGTTDEVRVYNRALSPKEVSDLYNWAPGPVLNYQFEEKSGTSATDISGNGNTGTINGTAAWKPGKYGSSLVANGSSTFISKSSASSFDFDGRDFTVEAWIKPTAATGDVEAGLVCLSSGSAGTTQWCLITDNDNYAMLTDNDGSWPYLDGAVTNNDVDTNWVHLAGVVSTGSSIKLYKNGVLVASDTSVTANLYNPASPVIWVGQGVDHGYFNGLIDGVQIYNYARTQKQVVQDMLGGRSLGVGSNVSQSSPVGYWKFDEGTDNTCSGGANDTCNSGSAGSALDGAQSGMAVPATSTSGWTQAGKFGKALVFDGSNDYVDLGDLSVTDNLSATTWSVWIKPTTLSGNHDFFTKWNTSQNHLLIRVDSNGAVLAFIPNALTDTGNNYGSTANSVISTGNWYHINVVFDGALAAADRIKIFVNGVQRSLTITGTIPTSLTNSSTSKYLIGQKQDSPVDSFVGSIDEPKIYNYALTADEVKLDYNRSSSLVLGSLSDNSSYQVQAANQEYCVPGDTTSCAAPVARYDFEEGTSTTAFDKSGNANTGTLTGGPTWTSGKVGKAINFDGSDDYVTVTDSGTSSLNLTSDLTIELWLKPSSSVASKTALAKDDGSSTGQYVLGFDASSKFRLTIAGVVDMQSSSNAVSANAWQHLTITKSGSAIKYYFNGAQDSSFTDASSLTANNAPLIIGAFNAPSTGNVTGQIDQIRIFNYARSGAQVAWDYNRGAPVGHWKFDECQGTTAYDSSGNANNGTITVGGSGTQTAVGTCTGSANTMWKDGVTGKRNYSLDFDGTDDYVDMNDPTALKITGAITVSAWIKTTDSSTGGVIYSKYGGGNNPTSPYIALGANGYAYLYVDDTGADGWTSRVSLKTVNDGTWHYVTTVFIPSSNMDVYIDGILSNGTLTGSIKSAMTDTTASANIGGANDTGNFNGQIDDVRVYNYALTATQIKQIMNDGAVRFGPSTGSP